MPLTWWGEELSPETAPVPACQRGRLRRVAALAEAVCMGCGLCVSAAYTAVPFMAMDQAVVAGSLIECLCDPVLALPQIWETQSLARLGSEGCRNRRRLESLILWRNM
ncbi:hypothetical protein N658DRAFT_205264 [Parathielavia hyrcaniae]|uniref:Uncharacterized protein n=1 Tax=Parathielavia hyrcaniae TaxID=113614 RepID=A0AAN6PW43_9PEZI|nr:hypothetical protein N658DRAFT_205264 [Parathielavia hyrcaniae]